MAGQLTATTQTALWAAIFFFASSAASSAYLTVSEIFPVELRGMVIALFFAWAPCSAGRWRPGSSAPHREREADELFYGDLFASALLLITVFIVGSTASRPSDHPWRMWPHRSRRSTTRRSKPPTERTAGESRGIRHSRMSRVELVAVHARTGDFRIFCRDVTLSEKKGSSNTGGSCIPLRRLAS